MTDPRSVSTATTTWLTDSRVYNLIWLGRWLERAEVISRAVNAAARWVAANGTTELTMGDALVPVAHAAGISVEDKTGLATELLLDNSTSSAMHCLSNARLNATQVAPVELIRVISEAILDLQETDPAALDSPERVIALTEEEVFHRFVQQQ